MNILYPDHVEHVKSVARRKVVLAALATAENRLAPTDTASIARRLRWEFGTVKLLLGHLRVGGYAEYSEEDHDWSVTDAGWQEAGVPLPIWRVAA